MATENIMMKATLQGGDRQQLHEAIRRHSVAAGFAVKELGMPNDLVSRIASDPLFGMNEDDISAELLPERFIGRASEQVSEYIEEIVQPVLIDNGIEQFKPPELKV